MDIFNKIHAKFSLNFQSAMRADDSLLKEVELKTRFIYNIGSELSNAQSTNTRREIIKIFDELFSDMTVCIYFSTCCIYNASYIIMRRVLELGIAILYFWDMPHKYWGWKTIPSHESDLNFKENIEYLSSTQYAEYLKHEFGIDNWVVDKVKFNAYYRAFSNTIHGKLDTFVTNTEKSFEHSDKEFFENIRQILKIQDLLLLLFARRFSEAFAQSEISIPSIERYKNGY